MNGWCALVPLAGVLWWSPAVAQPGLDLQALFRLSELLGQPVPAHTQLRLAASLPRGGDPLAVLKQAAGELGLPLTAVEADLAELGPLQRPCLIGLREPPGVAVLTGVDGEWVQCVDENGVHLERAQALMGRLSGLALAPTNPRAPSARLGLERRIIELGQLEPGCTVHAEARFFNRGNRDLHVQVLQTSCACTAAVVGRSAVPPGQAGVVRITLQPDRWGELEYTVALSTNDPLQARVFLTIRGSTDAGFLVSPPGIQAVVERGEQLSTQFHVTGPAQYHLTRVQVWDPIGKASLRLEEQTGSASTWHIDVELRAPGRPGEHGTRLVLATDDPDHPRLTVPVRLTVLRRLRVQPARLFLGSLSPGASASKQLSLWTRDGRPFRILQVKCSQSWAVPGAPRPRAGGYCIPVEVTAPANEEGLLQASLRIRTDVPGEEWVEVPLVGWGGSL